MPKKVLKKESKKTNTPKKHIDDERKTDLYGQWKRNQKANILGKDIGDENKNRIYGQWKTNLYRNHFKDDDDYDVKDDKNSDDMRGLTEEKQLEEFHKVEHRKRYGARTAQYKKGSENIGWRIQPRTDLKGKKRYKWGSLKDLYPPNLSNPLTCKIPSLVDFLETHQPKYFFYTLENWDFQNEKKIPVETNLIYKALLYWRLMLFTGGLDDNQTKIVKSYLKTASAIIKDRMPMFDYWPYKNGLVHYYGYKKDDTYKERNKQSNFISFNPDVPYIFFDYFNRLKDKLIPYSREMQKEISLKNKQVYWIKVFKTNFEKKEIPSEVVLKTDFNYQNLDLVVSSYLAWEHNKLKRSKDEPRIKLLADWKLLYSIYKEVDSLKNKNHKSFDVEDVSVQKVDYELTLGPPIPTRSIHNHSLK